MGAELPPGSGCFLGGGGAVLGCVGGFFGGWGLPRPRRPLASERRPARSRAVVMGRAVWGAFWGAALGWGGCFGGGGKADSWSVAPRPHPAPAAAFGASPRPEAISQRPKLRLSPTLAHAHATTNPPPTLPPSSAASALHRSPSPIPPPRHPPPGAPPPTRQNHAPQNNPQNTHTPPCPR